MSILRRFNSITMAQLPVVFFDITAGGQPVGRIEMTVSPAACGVASAESHLLKDSELQISADHHVFCLLCLPELKPSASRYMHTCACLNWATPNLRCSQSLLPLGHEEIFDQALITACVAQLRSDVVPRTAENFRALCTGRIRLAWPCICRSRWKFHRLPRMTAYA